MQIAGSQIGISAAIRPLFHLSPCLSETCHRPASRLTGSKSPRPATIAAVTRFTKSDSFGTTGGRSVFPARRCHRHFDGLQPLKCHIDRREVLLDDRLAALAV